MTMLELLRQRLPVRLARWAPQLVAAELCYGVDPYTMAAILDVESLGGDALNPSGPAGTGDHGFGHGLGQIDSRSHGSFVAARAFDGTRLWADPAFNILYAAKLLRSNMRGAGGDSLVAIAAYNCGLKRAQWAIAHKCTPASTEAERIAVLDSVTARGAYLSTVLKRRAAFLPPMKAEAAT